MLYEDMYAQVDPMAAPDDSEEKEEVIPDEEGVEKLDEEGKESEESPVEE